MISPAPPEAWDRLASAGGALPTQTRAWAQAVLAGTGGRDASRLHRLPDGRELLVPLVERGAGPARRLASWPYGWGCGGVLSSDGQVTSADVRLVVQDLARQGALRCSVVPAPGQPGWGAAALLARGTTDYLTHELDLTGGADAVWKGYSSNVRRSIRRAERSGLEVRRDDGGELLPVFAELHRLSVQRWAQASGRPAALARLQARLQEPPRHLRAVAAALGTGLVVWGAFLDGRPVAAVVVLRGCPSTVYWRGAMDREPAARTHANALLHHLAVQEAIADGARSYSFGESDEGSALAVYKEKFGARPVRWSAYHLERLPLTAAAARARSAYVQVARVPGVLSRLTAAPRGAPPGGAP